MLLALACVSCHREEEAQAPAATLVKTALVTRGTALEQIEIAGTLQALPGADVKLSTLSTGRLEEVKVGEGDAVKRGQLLARIDPQPLDAAVAEARAQLDQARAQEQNNELRTRRSERALDAGVAPRQEVEDAQLGLATAHSAVKAAQGALASAENQLARSELRAPFAGLVAHVLATPGETVDAGKPVIEVVQSRQLELRGAVAADTASRLQAGQPATLASAGGSLSARVIAVAPVIDPATGTATVRLRVENPLGALKVSQLARAEIEVSRHEGALLLPKAALLPGPTVCVVGKDSHAHCIAVQTRPAQDDQIEIISGLDAGAQVILQGAYGLPDGTLVRVDSGEPAAAEKPEK